jgi:NIMA (never in mitosis gene a)-related kinase
MIKLGDFGISKQLDSNYDMSSTFVGSPFYMAPEAIRERKYG